jgi:hypothetical protein
VLGQGLSIAVASLLGYLIWEAAKQCALAKFSDSENYLGTDPFRPRLLVVKDDLQTAKQKLSDALVAIESKNKWSIRENTAGGNNVFAEMPVKYRRDKFYLHLNAVFSPVSKGCDIRLVYRLKDHPFPDSESYKEMPRQLLTSVGAQVCLETNLMLVKSFGLLDENAIREKPFNLNDYMERMIEPFRR